MADPSYRSVLITAAEIEEANIKIANLGIKMTELQESLRARIAANGTNEYYESLDSRLDGYIDYTIKFLRDGDLVKNMMEDWTDKGPSDSELNSFLNVAELLVKQVSEDLGL
ncbi:hypothetical protein JOL62DRAFT_553105 [Phyllosticta paracitricarpa]|uniref:Uncharacterized protein n=1 Tax=Phyllosticta paracitricarpa TaxID=2016321 RepID=A0ABR1NIG7_9PEZI